MMGLFDSESLVCGQNDEWRGNPISFNPVVNHWEYKDGVPVKKDTDRACGKCGNKNTPEGHDFCLGTLTGVANACCGHGISENAYVQLLNKSRTCGAAAVELQSIMIQEAG